MISYQHVCNTRQWRATTGLTQDQFTLLTTHFEETYRFFYNQTINELAQAIEVEFKLPTYADCVFFVLFQPKNGLSYDALGLLIQTDASNAQRNFDK